MISRRIWVNLAFFGLIGVALLVWATTNVVAVDAIERPYSVTAEFATSPGLSQRFEVTYLGQRVGNIRSVELADDRVLVSMRIDRDVSVPAAVDAAVRRKSAVGEPYVDLVPREGTDPSAGPRLADGDHIPVEHTSTPLAYSELFAAADELLGAIDPDAAAVLLHELSVALDGRGSSIRELLVGTERIALDLQANGDLLAGVVDDLSTLASTFADHQGALGSGIDDVAVLADRLSASTADLEALLADGPAFGEALAEVVRAGGPSLGCTFSALATVGDHLDAETLASLRALISLSPQFAFVLEGAAAPSDGVGGVLFFNNGLGTPLPVYDEPQALPVPPEVPVCAEVLARYPGGPGDATVAGEAVPAVREPTPDGAVPDPSRPAVPGATVPGGPSSQLPVAHGADLGSLLPWAAAAAVLAAAGGLVFVVRRRRREDAPA